MFRSNLIYPKKLNLLSEESSIVFKTLEPKYVLTLVSGPFCKHCIKPYNILKKLSHENPNISLQIIFLSSDNLNHPSSVFVAHLNSLKFDGDKLLSIALDEWYNQLSKDYKKWSLKFPAKNFSGMESCVRAQNNWIREANLQFTPTILINGRLLPEQYKPDDLYYLLH